MTVLTMLAAVILLGAAAHWLYRYTEGQEHYGISTRRWVLLATLILAIVASIVLGQFEIPGAAAATFIILAMFILAGGINIILDPAAAFNNKGQTTRP